MLRKHPLNVMPTKVAYFFSPMHHFHCTMSDVVLLCSTMGEAKSWIPEAALWLNRQAVSEEWHVLTVIIAGTWTANTINMHAIFCCVFIVCDYVPKFGLFCLLSNKRYFEMLLSLYNFTTLHPCDWGAYPTENHFLNKHSKTQNDPHKVIKYPVMYVLDLATYRQLRCTWVTDTGAV